MTFGDPFVGLRWTTAMPYGLLPVAMVATVGEFGCRSNRTPVPGNRPSRV
jgi:hypothetical protein